MWKTHSKPHGYWKACVDNYVDNSVDNLWIKCGQKRYPHFIHIVIHTLSTSYPQVIHMLSTRYPHQDCIFILMVSSEAASMGSLAIFSSILLIPLMIVV